jgi:mono/diheme cytochrome c family protein
MTMTTKTWTAVALFLVALSLGAPAGGRADEGGTKGEDKALFRQGAQLWPEVCATCHNARPGGERSPAEWDTIMMHMRSVANLPEGDAQAIMAFLKAR